MGCVGCNDGCFDESVQLAQGPAGPAGEPGAEGSTTISNTGTDISVAGSGTSGDPYIINFTGTNGDHNVLETGVTQIDVTGNFAAAPNPVINKVINGTTENINSIGDIIRLEFFIIGETTTTDVSDFYEYKISFGGNTVFDTSIVTFLRLKRTSFEFENAAKVKLDLIVSAADAVTPVINHEAKYGNRASKFMVNSTTKGGRSFTQVLPSITGLTLSGNNTLSVALQSTNGTSNISLMSYKIIKFLKA